jgi:hypothetical protein
MVFSFHLICEDFFYEEVPSAALLPPGLPPWEAGVRYFEDFLVHGEPQILT